MKKLSEDKNNIDVIGDFKKILASINIV